jgi:transcriptional regulator
MPRLILSNRSNGIVGLELPIRRLEAKWKVSQNRTERERQGVTKGLAEINTAESIAMKALVEET